MRRYEPWGIVVGIALVLVGSCVGFIIYRMVENIERASLVEAVRSANVLCDWLNGKGATTQVAYGHTATGNEGTSGCVLTPGDMLILMEAAGIKGDENGPPQDEGKVTIDPAQSAAMWMMSALGTLKIGDTSISGLLGGDSLNLEGCAKPRSGTLVGILALYSQLGKQPTGERLDKLGKQICDEREKFVERLVDGKEDLGAIIKSQMQNPWGLYKEGRNLGGVEKCQYPLNRMVPVKECDEVRTSKYRWLRESVGLPAQEAIFKLSYFLTTEILRDQNVKKRRFLYKAWKGTVQCILVIAMVYLLVVLVSRVIVSLVVLGRAEPRRRVLWGALRRSRGTVDLVISLLPLIGLFGTVLGILRGLPNAAAAIMGQGAGSPNAVNSLFEQLGLAFSTTALAVLGVIVGQVLWEFVRRLEDRVAEKVEGG